MWSVTFKNADGVESLDLRANGEVHVVFKVAMHGGMLLKDDIFSITPVECLEYTSCAPSTSPENSDVAGLLVQHKQDSVLEWRWVGESFTPLEPATFVTTSASAKYNANSHSEVTCVARVLNLPGDCKAAAQIKAPMLSAATFSTNLNTSTTTILTPARERYQITTEMRDVDYWAKSLTILPSGPADYLCMAQGTRRYVSFIYLFI